MGSQNVFFLRVAPSKEEGRGVRNKGFRWEAMNQQPHFPDDCTVNKHLCSRPWEAAVQPAPGWLRNKMVATIDLYSDK